MQCPQYDLLYTPHHSTLYPFRHGINNGRAECSARLCHMCLHYSALHTVMNLTCPGPSHAFRPGSLRQMQHDAQFLMLQVDREYAMWIRGGFRLCPSCTRWPPKAQGKFKTACFSRAACFAHVFVFLLNYWLFSSSLTNECEGSGVPFTANPVSRHVQGLHMSCG